MSLAKVGNTRALSGAEPFALITSGIDPRNMRAGLSIHGIEKLGDLLYLLEIPSEPEFWVAARNQYRIDTLK